VRNVIYTSASDVRQASPRPATPTPLFENIPAELKSSRQFVLWTYEWRKTSGGNWKWTKPPCTPKGESASSTDATTWRSFDEIKAAYERGGFDGIGFVLTERDPYCGFDFDKCLNEKGDITDAAVTGYVNKLDSYTEISPSGRGLRIITRGKLPREGRRKGNIEIYDDERYLTLTGRLFPPGSQGRPIAERQDAINAVHREVFPQIYKRPRPYRQSSVANRLTLDDREVIAKAETAKNSERFIALYDRGDFENQGYSSQSEADLALCRMFAFWTGGDAEQIDRLFRRSKLMRDKWERQDYRERTIATAIEGCDQFYASEYSNLNGRLGEDVEGRTSWKKWPVPDEAMFCGPAGEFVKWADQRTEADPVAVLVHFLTFFGNAAGRYAYRKAGG
jgi:primase-polymerase (primpol)-like protein